MRRNVDRASIGALVAVIAWLTLGGSALGQIETGDYANGDPWYTDPVGQIGLRLIGTTQIERVSDGSTYILPAEVQPDPNDPPSYQVLFRLSPSQQFLFVQKWDHGGCTGQNPLEIFMYELGPAPTLLPFTSVTGPVCIEGTLGHLPEFYDHARIVRAMFLAGAAGGGMSADRHEVLWADLIRRELGVNRDAFLNGINLVGFAPGGEGALVIHGTGSPPSTPKYTFVDLCADPLGGVRSTPQDLPSGQIGMRVEEVSGEFLSVLLVNGTPHPGAEFTMSTACYGVPIACCLPFGGCDDTLTADDCLASGGAPTAGDCTTAECVEACCLPDGSCGLLPFDNPACDPQGTLTCGGVVCPLPMEACCLLDGTCMDTTPAMCALFTGGTSQGAGTECSSTSCPVMSLALTKSGPAQVRQGDTFDYTIDYLNDGDLLAPAVVLEDYVPSGSVFVSASHGGQDVGFGQIQWSLGDVPATGPGSSGQVTLTVRADCYATTVSNMATATASPGVTFFSNIATTLVQPALNDAVTVTVTSVPQNGSPVEGGDLITHTVTLTNSIAESRSGIQFSIFSGVGMTLDTLVDAGGGTVQMWSPASWDWTGTLGPSATVDIVFTTRVDACVDVDDVGLRKITVVNGCVDEIGSVVPDRLPVRRAVEAELVATSLAPPATLETFTSRETYQLLRRGDTVDFQFAATNPHASAINVSIVVFVPFGFDPDGDPPFIPPTDPGATWNPAARRIDWSGTIAPQQTVTISFRAVQTAELLSSYLTGSASDGTCTLSAGARLAIVPELPLESYVIGLHDDRLWTLRPGIDATSQDLFEFNTEYVTAMGRGDNGDLWVVSLPTFRFNPETLELQGLGVEILDRLGFTPNDVAVDPTDGTALFGGGIPVGFDTFAAIRRYDPTTDQVTTVFDEPGPVPSMQSVQDIVVEPTGVIGFRSGAQRLYRLDPTVGTPTDLSDNAVIPFYGPLALDEDDSYLVCAHNFRGPHPLADVAPDTGQHTTITPDLQSLLPSAMLPPGTLIAGNGGDVYFGYSFNGLGVLHQLPSLSADELLPFDVFASGIHDLAFYSSGPCNDNDSDRTPAGAGCATGTVQDCDDADDDVYPGAPEINDGKDNQCPGDIGAGAVDEVSGPMTVSASGEICWPAQSGATEYEVVRSTTPDFSSDCNRVRTTSTCWTDNTPPAGETWHYLVRALAPFPGSFGLDSAGLERTVSCP